MSNFHFSMKNNTRNHNKNIVTSMKSSNHLLNTQHNNFQFTMNNKKNAHCNSCPNDISNIKFENIDVKILENELIHAEKMLEKSTLNNKNVQEPCKNCNTISHIGFRINNNNDLITFQCNPTYYLDINEDYYFEKITVLNKNNDYILIHENMITNNSREKLTITMTNDFYNDLRMPLVLTAKCLLKNGKIYNLHGFII